MIGLFLKLLNMSIVASWIILAVLLLRLLLKKAPKWIVCSLWLVVGIRLVVPFSFESPFSLLPTADPLFENTLVQTERTEQTSKVQGELSFITEGSIPMFDLSNQETQEISKELPQTSPAIVGTDTNTASEKETDLVSERFLSLVCVVWIAGMLGMTAYALHSYLRIYKKARYSVAVEKNTFINDEIDAPFILGIFRPRIYMPSILSEGERAHVLAHEKAHLRRFDYIWKPLGYAVLTVYWFNPLIWLAYDLLCKDIEFACDERVIKKLNAPQTVAYTNTLLRCSVPRRMIVACPLAFGEVKVKERIKAVLYYKKPTFWMIIIAVVICIIFAVAFLTDPKDQTNTDSDTSSLLSADSVLQDDSSEESKEFSHTEESKDSTEASSEPVDSSVQEEPDANPSDREVACGFNSYEIHDRMYDDWIKTAAENAGCTFTPQTETEYSIVMFENRQQLLDFVDAVMQIAPDNDLGETLDTYNETFFEEHDLVIVCTGENSGGNRNKVLSVVRNGETLSISFLKTTGVTEDYIVLFNCLEFPKNEISHCNHFVLDITRVTLIQYAAENSQQVTLTDDECTAYLNYLNKDLQTDTFLLCLDRAEDVSSLIEKIGPSSEYASKLKLYDDKFFEKNALYIFYSQEADAQDLLKTPEFIASYEYCDYDHTLLRYELAISIEHYKMAPSDAAGVPQVLMFGLPRQEFDDVSYTVSVIDAVKTCY